MKIKAQVTIDIGQYENIKPEIEIDTENLTEAKKLLFDLWAEFHGITNQWNNLDQQTLFEMRKSDWTMQDLYDKVRTGQSIPMEAWQQLSISDQNLLHKAQLLAERDRRNKLKDESNSVQTQNTGQKGAGQERGAE